MGCIFSKNQSILPSFSSLNYENYDNYTKSNLEYFNPTPFNETNITI